MFRDVILVMSGGAVGSALRFLVGVMLPIAPGNFPWPTYLVNAVGSAALGLIAALATQHGVLSRHQALILGTGLCGGFTTFSTFSVETITLLERNRPDLAAIYVGATLTTTILGAWLGVLLARHFTS